MLTTCCRRRSSLSEGCQPGVVAGRMSVFEASKKGTACLFSKIHTRGEDLKILKFIVEEAWQWEKALINKSLRHLERRGLTFGQGLSQGPFFSVLTRCKSNKSIERVTLRAGDMHWKYAFNLQIIIRYHLKMLWAVLSCKKYCNSPKMVWKVFKEVGKHNIFSSICFSGASKGQKIPYIVFQELQEENRTLKRQIARQERDLARFTGAEGDLPVILRSNNSSKSIFISMYLFDLRAHNEETRVLKAKVKQVFDNTLNT